jgi:hypothetical protein
MVTMRTREDVRSTRAGTRSDDDRNRRAAEAVRQRSSQVERVGGNQAVQRLVRDTESTRSASAIAAAGVAGSGRQLPYRERLESAFDTDLRDVRLHDGGDAARATSALDAAAFATGDHVAIAGPATLPLVAHEAAHVVQQRRGVVDEATGLHEGSATEEAAARGARHAVAGTTAPASLLGGESVSPSPSNGSVVQPAPARSAATATGRTRQTEDWSGTDIPPPEERKRLRREAAAARKRNAERDSRLASIVPGQVDDFDRVLVGAGYAAILNVASQSQWLGLMAQSPPRLIAIGEPDPWQQRRKLMGQSPSLLSPGVLPVPPLHFVTEEMKPPERSTGAWDRDAYTRYLDSDAFAAAIAYARDHYQLAALHARVTSLGRTEDDDEQRTEPDRTYRLGVETNYSFALYSDAVDVVSGPGPPRQLRSEAPSRQITEDEREKLRKETKRSGRTYQRLVYGGESLQSSRDLPPPGSTVLVYGGSPTGAWAWERYYKAGQQHDVPYDIYWVAPLLGPRILGAPVGQPPSLDWAELPFDSARVGKRNRPTLARANRFTARLSDVRASNDGVSVEFTSPMSMEAPPVTEFAQVVVAIGQDPKREGGPVDLLEGIESLEGLEHLYGQQTGRRPLGVGSSSGGVRALGAAGVAAGFSADLFGESDREEFGESMGGFLGSLPPEAQVPPGITAAGVTIPQANDPVAGFKPPVNVNTASETELRTLLTVVLDDAEDAARLAPAAVSYRSYDPRMVRTPGIEHWPRYPGFRGVAEFVEWLDERTDIDEGRRSELRRLIRV